MSGAGPVVARLRDGTPVLGRVHPRYGLGPVTYVNRTQAERAAAKIPGAFVIQPSRPFFVRLPQEAAPSARVQA